MKLRPVLSPDGSTSSPHEPEDDRSRFDVYVLGRSQDGGLPHAGCEKPCCVDARDRGIVETPACLGIHDRETGRLVLIEATPGIDSQLRLLHDLTGVSGRGRQPVDAVLLTHAHIGHYTGLMYLGQEVADSHRTPVHVTPAMAAFLRDNGPWSQLVEQDNIDLIECAPGSVDGSGSAGAVFEPIEGLRVEAINVPHRDEFSDTVAFRIGGPARTLLFVPDIDRWDVRPGMLSSLLEGVDVAYVDGTFYDGRELPGRDLSEIPHPAMVTTMERLGERVAAHPGSIRFIHLNHTNPALTGSELQAEVAERGFAVADVGERQPL
ncbi:MAG: MBL fold metallo-hydrolase [Planctomycetota bacterium]|nr:MBL fold metallo-hydrolase [Planctomycetota bacterium]